MPPKKSSKSNEREPLLPIESTNKMPHNHDTERDSSSAELHNTNGDDDDDFGPDEKDSTFRHILQFLGGGVFFPDPSTADPIGILLNTQNPEKRDNLIKKWRDNKLSELNFVGVVSALLAGVLTSTGSWPAILPSGELSPWPIRTSWYCGIALALFSILCAADQTVRLHRLSAHRDGPAKIYELLSKRHSVGGQGRKSPSTLQIMTWQMPVMFLTSSTLCMIVGMFLHVWSATVHVWQPGLWDDNAKVCKEMGMWMREVLTGVGCGYIYDCRECVNCYLCGWAVCVECAAEAWMIEGRGVWWMRTECRPKGKDVLWPTSLPSIVWSFSAQRRIRAMRNSHAGTLRACTEASIARHVAHQECLHW